MTIDFWGLGLQAVNVLILVWVLSRVFWRPVAGAIAQRQDAAQAIIDKARATQASADAALAEATQARDDFAAERAALLDAARAEADTASKAVLAEARSSADAMLDTARATIERDTETARKADESRASDLSLEIAAHLLRRLDGPAVQAAFLSQLIEAIASMPADDRCALSTGPDGLEIVSATDVGADGDRLGPAIAAALGGTPELRFVCDPDLIAGLELRSPHFVLHNSWQADLAQVRKAVQDAA